jgi:DNA-binding transcriptional ArsR family regulator
MPRHGKSTLSHHFRLLREAGIIRTRKMGVEHRNVLRIDDINVRFPDLLNQILQFAD